MSSKSLLSNEQQLIFYNEYHKFLSNVRYSSEKNHLHDFFKKLRRENKDFKKYTDKELSNKIIASRRLEGLKRMAKLKQS